MAGELKHFDIVMVVTDGHDLIASIAAMGCPALQGVALGAAGVENIDHGEVAVGIFGAQHGDAVVVLHAGGLESAQGLDHAGGGAAEHGLYGVGEEGILDGHDEVDVLDIFFQPAVDAVVEVVEALDDDGSLGFLIKSKNGVAAEGLHGDAQVAAGVTGHEIAVEGFSRERAGDGAVGADEPEIEAELLSDGEGEGVAASGDEDDFDAGGVGAAEGGEVVGGDLELGIEEGAVDIGGDEADGQGLGDLGILGQQTWVLGHFFIVT